MSAYIMGLVSILCLSLGLISEAKDIELRMPNVRPENNDEYMCHSIEVGKSSVYVTGFVPHAKMDTAHHMLLYGCTVPGSEKQVWDCGEMSSHKTALRSGPTCKEGGAIVYAWAMDAPALTLPKDVAFKLGDGTPIQYLVLQVHYKNVTKFKQSASMTDNSGITMKTQTTPTKKLAGIYLLGTDGEIPAHSTVFLETACSYTGHATLHPFAFRTHTHKLGELVSGFRVRGKEWTEIGRKSPQKPQMFYNVTNTNLEIKPGDTLAARCIMKNGLNKDVRIGNTQQDEMCNFYMMYWVDAKDEAQLADVRNQDCFSAGWPNFKWDEFLDVSGVPSTAATIPGTKNMIKEMISEMNDMETNMRNAFAEDMFPMEQLPGAEDMLSDDAWPFAREDLQEYERE